MNRRRGVLIGASVVVGLLVCLVGLLSLSSVQTSLAKRVLAARPEIEVDFTRLSVGLNELDLTDLSFRRGALTVKAPHVRVNVSLWDLWSDVVDIEHFEARGWTATWTETASVAQGSLPTAIPAAGHQAVAGWFLRLDLAQLSGAAAAEAAVALPINWQDGLQLPVRLEVGAVDLEGQAIWRNAGPGADGHAAVRVSGGQIEAGKPGDLRMQIAAQSDAPSATGIQYLEIDTHLSVQINNADHVDGIKVSADLVGRRSDRSDIDRYRLEFALASGSPKPRFDLELRQNDKPLVGLFLATGDDVTVLAGEWNLAMTDVSLRNLMLGRDLPTFMLEGSGMLRADSTFSDLEIAGDLRFQGDDFRAIRPELGAVGPLSGTVSFALQRTVGDLRCTRLELAVNGIDPVARIRLLQGIEYASSSGEVRVADPTDPVVEIDMQGLPVAWAQPWLDPWVVAAKPLHGRMTILVTPHGIRMVTTDPLQAEGLVVSSGGTALVDDLRAEVSFGAEFSDEGWQIEVDRLDLARAGATVASLSARGGQLSRGDGLLKVAGRMRVDLAQLNRFPVLEGYPLLAEGQLVGDFGLGRGDRMSVAASMNLTKLTSTADVELPDVRVDGRVDLLADGGIEAHLPFQFTRSERVSELTLNVQARPDTGGWQAEGSLSGPRAYVQDLQLLAAPFAMAESPDSETSVPPATGDATKSVWQGISGTFKTAIGHLELPDGTVLTNVRGDLVVDADKILVDGVHANIGTDGQIEVSGDLAFSPNKDAPYAANGHVEAKAIEMGAVLRALQPAAAPAIEGKVNVSAEWKSVVSSFDELADNSELSAHVSSAGGVVRALGVKVDQYVKSGKTVAMLGGLIALASGDTRAQRVADRLQAASQVAEQLSAFAFDQLNVEFNRAPQGDIVLSDLSLISPSFRLLGNGRIGYREELPFWLQPLVATIQLSAREEMGKKLQALNLVGSEADALGYLPFNRSIQIDGTLSKFDAADLERMIAKAVSAL